MALLDSKAGQEDVSSISRAMGDVKESLGIVAGSLPGDTSNVITALQVIEKSNHFRFLGTNDFVRTVVN